MTNPLLTDAPAVERARERDSTIVVEGEALAFGAPSLERTKRRPSRANAAITAGVSVTVTSVWAYIFTAPEMPRIDPILRYSWYVPTSPLFTTVWLALTLSMAASFYLVLRAQPRNRARYWAIVGFVAQMILQSVWACVFFSFTSPVFGLFVMVPFVVAVAVTIWFSMHASRMAALLLAPYVSWVSFIMLLTISAAGSVTGLA